jgi:hypothetical protein
VHPEFLEALQLGKKSSDDRVERSLYARELRRQGQSGAQQALNFHLSA